MLDKLSEIGFFEETAQNCSAFQTWLHVKVLKGMEEKSLPLFKSGVTADMIGVSKVSLANWERDGVFTHVKRVARGSVNERIYSLEDINMIRAAKGLLPEKLGSRACRITFSNLKGGIGKTSHSVHFAQYLALHGYKVLIIDMDSQATATQTFGYVPDVHLTINDTLYNALTREASDIVSVVRKTYWHNLDLLPCNISFQNADSMMSVSDAHPILGSSKYRLERALEYIDDQYDFIVIDTPPSSGYISHNAHVSADYLVTPLSSDMYAVSSSTQYYRNLAELSKQTKHLGGLNIRKSSVLITRHQQTNSSEFIYEQVKNVFGSMVMSNIMRSTNELQNNALNLVTMYETSALGNSQSHKKALEMMNNVNAEILHNAKSVWCSI